jgi:lysozyme family protein
MLWCFERYNGVGYRRLCNPSPHPWSFPRPVE